MRISNLAVAVILQLWSGLAYASELPSGPIRLIVPYPAGSSGDIIIRKVAPLISRNIGTTVYVDNRGGANGNLAMEATKNARPDGTTFVVGTDIQFSISPVIYASLPFDVTKDFEPIGPLARIDLVLVAQKNLRANNIRELIDLARMEPGKLTYASTGIGSSHQLYMELLKIMNSADILHVPYRGTGHATPDLISGQVDMMFFGSAQAIAGVKGGLIKALGAGSRQRMKQLPDIPTIAEQTNSDFQANNIWGIWAPAHTPPGVVAKMRSALDLALSDPEVRNWYEESALTFIDGGEREMSSIIQQQRTKWREVISKAGIKPIE